MPGEFEKYAVYWVPKNPDALAKFGVSWTGWCAERGEHRPRDAFRSIDLDVPAITRQVWRHGFHGVIQAPFRLQAGSGRFALEHALGRVIEESVAFQMPDLCLAVVGGSVAALVPHQSCAALTALVDRVGEAMTPLDAAPAPNGIVTGDVDSLVQLPAADAHRFHMPLTDQLPLELAFQAMEALKPLLEPLMGKPRHLHDVALMGDPGEGRPLRVLQRYILRDTPRQLGANPMPCQGPHMLAPMFSDPTAGTGLAI